MDNFEVEFFEKDDGSFPVEEFILSQDIKMRAKNFRETLNKELKNPEFKKEWDSLEPEYQIVRAILESRKETGITQKQLAEITGINQADISRYENGSGNPSLKTLKRLAEGMGKTLEIKFL